jgi:hypothetical protein
MVISSRRSGGHVMIDLAETAMRPLGRTITW